MQRTQWECSAWIFIDKSAVQIRAEQSASCYVWEARGENWNEIKWQAKRGALRPSARLQSPEKFPSPLLTPYSFKHEHCLWPPGEPAWLSEWPCLAAEEKPGQPLPRPLWLQVTNAHTCFLCGLSPILGRVGSQKKPSRQHFTRKTQVSGNTIKEIWIDPIFQPSRKHNWIQTFSRLSSNKYSGHQAAYYIPVRLFAFMQPHRRCSRKEQGCCFPHSPKSISWLTVEREAPCNGPSLHTVHHITRNQFCLCVLDNRWNIVLFCVHVCVCTCKLSAWIFGLLT